MDRIKDANLEWQVVQLNGGKKVPFNTVDSYCLSYAYGGVQLQKVVNEGGGVINISTGGYVTKRDLYNQLNTLLNVLGRVTI